jgi:putative nucleotidyltransferase with HDIG domain
MPGNRSVSEPTFFLNAKPLVALGPAERPFPSHQASLPVSEYASESCGWEGLLLGLLREVACRDPELRSHCDRVCGLSLRIARGQGLADERLDLLRAAALLHDIGKLLIPAGILEKPGKLSLAEVREVRHHAIHGEQMLKALSLPAQVCRFVRAHHERYNGKGYPDRLAGEHIPLESRILGLADAYDAMTADRPYHAGMGGRAACRRIQRLSGIDFDPRVVASFLPLPAGGVEFLPRGIAFAAPAALEA